MNNKDTYISFAKEQKLPLHIQPFWLDAVCGENNWDVAISYSKENKVIGALPYFFKRSNGLRFIKMPPFTDFLGPWIKMENEEGMKRVRQYIQYKKHLSQLIDQLPTSTYFFQQLHPSCEDWLPFKWEGFQQTTYYTYQLNLNQPSEDIFHQFRRNTQRNIKNSNNALRLERSSDGTVLFELLNKTFKEQGKSLNFTLNQLNNLLQALKKYQQGEVFIAKNITTQRINAACLVAWDHETVYTVLSASAGNLPSKVSPSWLNWQIIQTFISTHQKLDFCGSIFPDIEHATIGLGGKRVPFYKIYKSKNLFWWLVAKLADSEYA